MTTQDPELSAALGWPGGISDPVLDRVQLLQMVAALRLASKQALEALELGDEWHPSTLAAITALRAALAQQAEPVQEPEAPIGYLSRVRAQVEQQRTCFPGEEPDYLWTYTHGTKNLELFESSSDLDVVRVYTASPQRKPLTEGEISAMAQKTWKPSVYYDAFSLLGTDNLVALARAVEKASWEKNHGQA